MTLYHERDDFVQGIHPHSYIDFQNGEYETISHSLYVATLPFVLYLYVCGSKVGNPFSRPFLTFYKVKGRWKLLVLALLFRRTYLSLVRFLAVAKLPLLAYPVMQVLHHPEKKMAPNIQK